MHDWQNALFLTLTYKGLRFDAARMEHEARRFLFFLCRRSRAHMTAIIGGEVGENSHLHMVVRSPDVRSSGNLLSVARRRQAWAFGRTEIQRYDHSKQGLTYVLNHPVVIDTLGEVFCPRKGSCRRGHCPHPRMIESARLL